MKTSRRSFLGSTALGVTAAATDAPALSQPAKGGQAGPELHPELMEGSATHSYPRTFTGRHLSMIAFPLGGVGAGSVSLGGRGQLRDWEIFNRADKGNSLSYSLPSIWVQSGREKPVTRVLEARYQPPYEGQDGLGSDNAPGLSRLASAHFTGAYPFAQIDFEDRDLPVSVSLEAFSPFIPHEPDESGLPVAILRYRIRNVSRRPARVAIAWSLENPVLSRERSAPRRPELDKRMNEFREGGGLSGLLMSNPGLAESDVFHGTFALATRNQSGAKLTYLRGWPKGRWWNSPLLFWDDFSADGELGPEAEQVSAIGALCLTQTVTAGASATNEFLLAWHFPNRTPERCGWDAPPGDEHVVIGNWYTTRFHDAWDAAAYAVARLDGLERKTRLFAESLHRSTLPDAVKDAASANLSTLATPVCFRTADGEFHGFEGVDDTLGCCFGNCTHVWNYETVTAHLFPSFSRSLRKSAFGFSMDEAGAMHFRQLLPDGKQRSGFAAADGQMGQILHAYLDWIMSGDRQWLESLWPRIKKAIQFAWIPGGWDANRDGVMEGVQHNTFDIEFYGPNPHCGIYYLGALRACEEMARALGESGFADGCRRLFEGGRSWIDSNLFNGQYYIQQVRPSRNGDIAPSLRSSMGADDPEHPEYQLGKGCLVDQLIGQYLAEVCGLGFLLDERHVRTTLESIYRYNHKPALYQHDSVQRTYALNDEPALIVCDYASAPRPRIPFPYFAEVWTGFEYAAAALMLFAGMPHGTDCVIDARNRYDGARRNPWDETECGHHYVRAMSAWSTVLALSGFRYHGGERRVSIFPKLPAQAFTSFWSTGTGWGIFSQTRTATHANIQVRVHSGHLPFAVCEMEGTPGPSHVVLNGTEVPHRVERVTSGFAVHTENIIDVGEGDEVSFRFGG
jgi:non-lysosomal glucosylceramidase